MNQNSKHKQLFAPQKSKISTIDLNPFGVDCQLDMLREDLLHPIVSGNKFRKLKYPLKVAIENSSSGILTFGGAYSNHIHATAYACKQLGLKSVGIIRGDELSAENETLQFAIEQGMQLKFITREDYRKRNESGFLKTLQAQFPNYLIMPEGGASKNGVLGCAEILQSQSTNYDVVSVAAGTGTTAAGLLRSIPDSAALWIFSVLKGNWMKSEIEHLAIKPTRKTDRIFTNYHRGGYAKVDDELKLFTSEFLAITGIQLDYIYNGKAVLGLISELRSQRLKSKRVLHIHTGGVQGNYGFTKG